MRTPRALAVGLNAALLLGACSTGGPTDDRGGGTTGAGPTAYASASSAPSPAPSTTAAEQTPTPGPTSTPKPAPDPASIAALIAMQYDGGNLRLGRERGSTDAYRQYFATYESNGLTISGRINIPRGTGPFPAVVLAHGYVDPAVYTNGETMLRERDHLARQGYVTLHIDYRNHAQSDTDPRNDANLRAGYAVDAINAGLALKKAQVVDPDRVALIGRSMGGGVVYTALVVRPGLFRAAVAYAPVSSDTVDNFDKWVRRDASRSGAARAVIGRLGTPEAKPAAWAATSPRTYFGRITEPLLIHHGTADEDCPLSWSRESVAALKAEGKDVELRIYPGGRHTLTSPQWDTSIRRTEAFLAEHLG
ncbi:S9 family peptidase [Terrabacter sp. Ter38]|uniref:alpha/beta hydrolase family protein n=1 Tax=Terrabacter sp. Ter38 TaxID=2926030 RepID=UPI00211925AC|nr:alpha/beta fold hydrolase [Terrabacter sp. Ter38]